MGYYKIKNITDTLPKRHASKNKVLDITYNVGFIPKIYSLEKNSEMIISCGNLPINIHTLRTKGFITVQKISENEFIKSQRPNAKKNVPSKPLKKNKRTTKIKQNKTSEVSDKKGGKQIKKTEMFQ